jgi:hypothetical protein
MDVGPMRVTGELIRSLTRVRVRTDLTLVTKQAPSLFAGFSIYNFPFRRRMG